MKVKYSKTLKNGKRHVLVELDKGERVVSFDEDQYYRLGGQVEDVVRGHVITEANQVVWCSVSQEWQA